MEYGMSVAEAISSDEQLTRVLQIGVVLEELVEARAYYHYQTIGGDVDADVESLLREAREESREHRRSIEALIEDLEAETVPYDEIEALVRERYETSTAETVEALLRDQLASEETAYTYYDAVIDAIETGNAEFGVDRDRLLSTLREIRAEEADGVDEVTELLGRR